MIFVITFVAFVLKTFFLLCVLCASAVKTLNPSLQILKGSYLKRFVSTSLLCLAALALTACVTREQADAKLANGCKTGVETLLEDGQTIDKFTPAFSSPEPGQRHIVLTAYLKDDPDNAQTYDCLFEESFGPMNSSHNAMISRVQVGDKILGKAGDKIEGDAEDFIKLDTAVAKGMRQ